MALRVALRLEAIAIRLLKAFLFNRFTFRVSAKRWKVVACLAVKPPFGSLPRTSRRLWPAGGQVRFRRHLLFS